MPQYAFLKQNMVGHILPVRHVGMRNRNRLYAFQDPNAMRFDAPDNSRPAPPHNLNITRIRNHSNPTCGGKWPPAVQKLLTRRNVTWDDLHRLLSKAHLRLEKGETGGYTVLAIDHNIRVKASDVFRNNFAGKINRQDTETALGAWTPASTSGYEAAQHAVRTPVRNSALREERKAQRRADRVSLMADYNQYRNRQREVCKGLDRTRKRSTSATGSESPATKEGNSRDDCAMVGQENTVVSGNSSIGHRDEDSEGDGAAKTTRTIPERSPHLGC